MRHPIIPRGGTMFKHFSVLFMIYWSGMASGAELASPDGQVRVDVGVESGQLGYRVTVDGQELVARSPLGIDSSAGDFTTGVRVFAQSVPVEVVTNYALAAG